MSVLLGIGGPIDSGKTTLAALLGELAENHARLESSGPIIEIANRFNQLLEAELNFDTTDDDTELVNQALIWMPDVIAEHLHRNVTWTQIALTPKDMRTHPLLYEKLFTYLKAVRANPALIEQTVTATNKSSYRALLQWLGGYFIAKIGPTVWYDELFRRIDLHENFRSLIIISGVRSQSDAASIRAHGGQVILVARKSVPDDNTDVTEASRSHIEPDIIVHNNGTLAELQLLAENLWNDIAAGKPKKNYGAA